MNGRYIDPTNQPLDKSIPSAPLGKRVFAFLIDIVCLFIFSSFLNSTLVPVIQKNFYDQTQLKKDTTDRLLLTHMYVENPEKEETYYLIYNMYTEEQLKEKEDADKLEYVSLMEINLNLLIEEGNFTCYTAENLKDFKLKAEDVFVFNQEKNEIEYVADITTDKKVEFFMSACQDAYHTITTKDEAITAAFNKLNRINMLEIVGCMALVGTVLFVVIPLCSKKGQTLGKRMNEVAVIEKNDKPARKWIILIRYAIIAYIEVVASIFTYGIPLLASLTVMCFSKKKVALHDLIVSTKVISANQYPTTEKDEEVADDLAPAVLSNNEVSEVSESPNNEESEEDNGPINPQA